MASKLPYYPMYVDDFDDDQNVIAMSLAEVGLYQLTLNAAWRFGSIPDDIEGTAILIRRKAADVKKAWPKVRACFVPSGEPGRIVNPRQEIERGKVLKPISTDRVKRHRERKRNGNGTFLEQNETLNETPGNENETISETFLKRKMKLRAFGSGSESDSAISERGAGENENPLYEHFNALMAAWEGHKTEIDLGAQVWISLVDTGDITGESVVDVFAGLERWKTSEQWAKGYVPSVAKWLQGKRWKDSPKQQEGDKW